MGDLSGGILNVGVIRSDAALVYDKEGDLRGPAISYEGQGRLHRHLTNELEIDGLSTLKKGSVLSFHLRDGILSIAMDGDSVGEAIGLDGHTLCPFVGFYKQIYHTRHPPKTAL